MPPKKTQNASSSSSLSFGQPARSKPGRADLNSSNFAVKQRPFKPLLSVSKLPAFDLSGKGKAKAKPKPEVISLVDDSDDETPIPCCSTDDRLWVDRYEPQSESELAVHKRKVEDVRRWFQEAFDGGPTGKLKKYRRILVLTGPAGTAKTSTVRVLSKELGFQISEWRSALLESYSADDLDHEGLNQKFETFLARAGSYRPLLGTTPTGSSNSLLSSSIPHNSTQEKKQVILLEDLPNIFHAPTQAILHDALESFTAIPQSSPLVIIISDASTRGEVRDERMAQGGGGFQSSRDTIDIRSVLPPSLLNGPYVSQIVFNPIAPTLMLRALQEMLSRHYSNSDVPSNRRPTKEDLNIIVDTSNGDIRSAVMALQFACVLDGSSRKSTKSKNGTRALMEVVTRREQALALFHLMGKVLYNKRKHDPPSSSASAKDKQRERELDARLKESLPLPPWLINHKREPSRIDVDNLYAESPIDTGLFSLYISQNYTQFCDDIDQCEALSDWLSWIDSSGGEHWYQTNPHQFHLLTLGTLHSLPTPVARRGQKMYKPEFFDILKKSREAEDAVGDVWRWLQDSGSAQWSREEISTEMGSVLKARTFGSAGGNGQVPPPAHSTFTSFVFTHSDSSKGITLDADGDVEDRFQMPREDDTIRRLNRKKAEEHSEGEGWLSDDDIDDF